MIAPNPVTFAHPVAVAGIMMPTNVARVSIGRQYITDVLDALRLFAGANSMAIGETLLTIPNSSVPAFFEIQHTAPRTI
jgi:biotin synthase